MKKMMLLLLILVTPSLYGQQSVVMSPVNFQLSGDQALSKFEQVIFYPEGMLKRYKPTGAQISNKRVSQNTINFVATKYFLFIPKSVYVNGMLETAEDAQACPRDNYGYRLRMSFDGSDGIVTNNVERLEVTICFRAQSDISFVGTVRARIIIGSNYSSLLGPMAIDLIKLQLPPLISALSEEIKSLK